MDLKDLLAELDKDGDLEASAVHGSAPGEAAPWRKRKRPNRHAGDRTNAWEASAAEQRREEQEARRHQWIAYHLRTADSLERTAAYLANEHRAAAERLGGEA